MPSISISSDSQLGPLNSPKLDSESSKSKHSELQEKRDAVATLVFKCLALALSNHCENQLFFSAKLMFKHVSDALWLYNFIPQSPSGDCANWLNSLSSQQREANTSSQNLANCGSEDSSHSNAHPAVVMLRVPVPLQPPPI
ncbi:hypothetical protein PCASD_05371 [Puccinia coronata f. sp. avenae]|uniref:Uncharacterized protein n=1 Tax=Puccinia coronata f. sp. avenae TaxID=200324 RepID=A0A2N5UNU6_9BASI|nr:hypothetical protein PCASD_05371 [Puccinia coronata f. sp. avenae]